MLAHVYIYQVPIANYVDCFLCVVLCTQAEVIRFVIVALFIAALAYKVFTSQTYVMYVHVRMHAYVCIRTYEYEYKLACISL